MSNLRQAAQQALEALEILDKVMQRSPRTESAITALRASLAEPEQNPFGDDAERYARKLHEEQATIKQLELDAQQWRDIHDAVVADSDKLYAELRRLHTENEALREANEAFGKRQEWWNDKMVALEERNAELVEALRGCVTALDALWQPADSIYTRAADAAERALAKAQGEIK